MGDTRRKGLKYLESKLGLPLPRCVAVSKLFPPEESWTHEETWWFDLPIEKIGRLLQEDYHLLGEREDGRYVWLRVPNKDLHERMNMDRFVQCQGRIRLHLAARKESWLIDERSHGRVDFSKYEVKDEP